MVSAADQVAANAAAKVVDPVGGEFAFTVGLLAKASPDTKTTNDYYVCNWQLEDGELEALQTQFIKAGIAAQVKVHTLDKIDPASARPTFDEVKTIENVKQPPSKTDGGVKSGAVNPK